MSTQILKILKTHRLLLAAVGLLFVSALKFAAPATASLPSDCAVAGGTATCTFSYTGATQDFTVPWGVTSVTFDVAGAQGGASPYGATGGKGAHVSGTLVVTPSQPIDLTVAGQGVQPTGGFGGGGNGAPNQGYPDPSGSGGGGASTVASGGAPLIIAAGGGGSGRGGNGGDSGSPGTTSFDLRSGQAGGAATTSAGGSGGAGGLRPNCAPPADLAGLAGSNGAIGVGGDGGSGGGGATVVANGGGGGGGGYYGGGGGGGGDRCINITNAGGGGGGSSYIDQSVTDSTFTDGAQSGNGSITIVFTVPPDSSAPTDSPTVDGTLGNNDWYTSDVTVSWNWADSESGIDAGNCTQSSTSSGEGSSVDVSATCHDVAGNTASSSKTFKIDKTPPTATCEAPAPVVTLGTPGATVSASIADVTSGPAESTVSAPIDTSAAGAYTASITGHDNAGNSTTVNCSYTVPYGFGGFSSPRPGSKLHLSRSSTTISVEFVLTDGSGRQIAATAAAALAAAGSVTATLDGPGIIPQSAQCGWSSRQHRFQCDVAIPHGLTSSPYTITAAEDLGGGFITAPAVGSAVNPETVYFK